MKYLNYIIALMFIINIANAEDYFYDKAGRLIEVAYDDGNYLTFTYDNNGNITSRVISIESSVLNELERTVNLRSYPNPAGTAFTISFNLEEASPAIIYIYDSKGSLVNKVPFGHLNPGEHQLEISTTDATGKELASGSYIISLEVKHKHKSITIDHEIIIQK